MTLFATVDPRPIHFMGIAGAGMSGLALLARQQGAAITGCDNDPSGAADLAALGVEIWRGGRPRPPADGPGALVPPPTGPGAPRQGGGHRPSGLAAGAGGAAPPPPPPRGGGGGGARPHPT